MKLVSWNDITIGELGLLKGEAFVDGGLNAVVVLEGGETAADFYAGRVQADDAGLNSIKKIEW
jgi:hypothetical protein